MASPYGKPTGRRGPAERISYRQVVNAFSERGPCSPKTTVSKGRWKMRALILVVLVILAIIFLGGGVNLGKAPLFGHIDAVLGTNALMNMHYAIFSWLYRGERSVAEGIGRTGGDIDEFTKRPLGIDNPKKYRQLDRALDESGK